MQYKRYEDEILVRLDRGEEIIASLKRICMENNVKSGVITGIGATDRAVIGIYDTTIKKYKNTDITADHEITSLNGNISMVKDDVVIHIHVTLSDKDHRVKGGHLHSAYVSVTFEAIIHVLNADTQRVHDPSTGLNLLSFR